MIVKGDGGSFGFQIHGSQPAVISTVDIGLWNFFLFLNIFIVSITCTYHLYL